MSRLDAALRDLHALDLCATRDTPLHRLDPRAKVVVTLVFMVCVASFDRYTVAPLVPFLLFPVALAARGGIPLRFLLRKILLALPFALLVGAWNPVLDRAPLVVLGPLTLSGGWVSFCSILLRALLTVAAALCLIAVTGFPAVCAALERLGMPRVFAVQLLFLHRYLFVLADEGGRMARARELRTVAGRGLGLASYGPLIGSLLLRTWERAERVHRAMLSRGFQGDFPVRRPYRFGRHEALFTLGWCALFILLRFVNLPQFVGTIITEALS